MPWNEWTDGIAKQKIQKLNLAGDGMSLIFETHRLLLKPILESDLNTLHSIFINPYVRKYLCDDKVLSLQQVEEMLIESQKLFDERRFGLWFIETKDEKEIIGFVGLWYFFDEEQPQLAYALLPEATKKGYATEAATRILEYCFNELGYQYLLTSCDKPNLESRKLAERIGMREVEERIVNGNPLLFFRVERL
jgi:[ribosomal protein S5]-alanine N-acetyltransferase